jgi:hypothetical protein
MVRSCKLPDWAKTKARELYVHRIYIKGGFPQNRMQHVSYYCPACGGVLERDVVHECDVVLRRLQRMLG